MPRIEKKIIPLQSFTRCPNRNEHGDVYSKTLIHSGILEGSKGGSWKSIGRFAYQVFCHWDCQRVIRVHKGPLLPILWHKRRNWKLFVLAQALTVTASAWVKAREDSRTDSTKRPEGGNGGVGRAIRKYETWGPG
jgi:hypothetical protein